MNSRSVRKEKEALQLQYQDVIDFANEELTVQTWQERLNQAVVGRQMYNVWDQQNSPKILGKEASFEEACRLRILLGRLLNKLTGDFDYQRLSRRMQKRSNYKLRREVYVTPEGCSFSIDLLKDVDIGVILVFQAVSLAYKIELSRNSGNRFEAKTFHGDVVGIDVFPTYRPSVALRVRICKCGCRKVFIESGRKERKFIDGKHRKAYFNNLYSKNGYKEDYRKRVYAKGKTDKQFRKKGNDKNG